MRTLLAQVRAFMVACGQASPQSGAPAVPKPDVKCLREELIEEEYEELREAMKNDDMVEIADALGDLMYVCAGTAIAYNIPLDQVWGEIQRSNMDKIDFDLGRARKGGNGKVLKPEGWVAPRIKEILENARKAYGG